MSRGEELLKMARASLFRSQANAMGSRAANQAFRKMANRRMTDRIFTLQSIQRLAERARLVFGRRPRIPEHLKDGHLTTNEREWLRAFIQRWNAACDRERASAVAA